MISSVKTSDISSSDRSYLQDVPLHGHVELGEVDAHVHGGRVVLGLVGGGGGGVYLLLVPEVHLPGQNGELLELSFTVELQMFAKILQSQRRLLVESTY